jgi:pyrroline-5-carboxylate reductase
MKVAIIGAGNIGTALAKGFAKGTLVKEEDISISNRSLAKLEALKEECPAIHISQDNKAVVADADIVFLCVKPWKIEMVIQEVKHKLDYSRQMIVSLAAGVGTAALTGYLDKRDGVLPPVFYLIPNTAISVQSSMTFFCSSNASEEQEALIEQLFSELGQAMKVEERLMGPGTVLASCGIAYAMRYIRATVEGGIELGFYPKDAQKIVLHTLKGAVDLLIATGNHPEEEIDKVTTPGGVTIKGLNEMERAGFTSSVILGLRAGLTKE